MQHRDTTSEDARPSSRPPLLGQDVRREGRGGLLRLRGHLGKAPRKAGRETGSKQFVPEAGEEGRDWPPPAPGGERGRDRQTD